MGWTAVFVESEDGRVLGYIAELNNVRAQADTVEECEQRLRMVLKYALIQNRRTTARIFRRFRCLGEEPLDAAGDYDA